MEVRILGQMDNTIDHTFESANRVYDTKGLAPIINTCGGGGLQPKIIEGTNMNKDCEMLGMLGDEGFEKVRRVDSTEAVCPTISTKEDRIKVMINDTVCVGGLSDSKWGEKQYHQQDRVYYGDIALAEPANLPGGSYKYCVAMRGRGENNEQKIQKVGQISNGGSQCGTVISDGGLVPTLTAGTHGYANAHVCTRYKIRKLTPKECWRLMGFSDADFMKAEKVVSNTQLYKQAGNSIVKQVLMAIFSQMNIKGVKPWNEEKRNGTYCTIQ